MDCLHYLCVLSPGGGDRMFFHRQKGGPKFFSRRHRGDHNFWSTFRILHIESHDFLGMIKVLGRVNKASRNQLISSFGFKIHVLGQLAIWFKIEFFPELLISSLSFEGRFFLKGD